MPGSKRPGDELLNIKMGRFSLEVWEYHRQSEASFLHSAHRRVSSLSISISLNFYLIRSSIISRPISLKPNLSSAPAS